jgi:DNA modification methylase
LAKLSIIQGDATHLDLPSNSVDLIITHPPYFGIDTKRYGGDESKQINAVGVSQKNFLKQMTKATEEMFRVLKPYGQLWIANSPFNGVGSMYVADTLNKTKFEYVDCVYHTSYFDKDVIPNKLMESIAYNSVTVWHHFAKNNELYYNQIECKKYNNPVWELDFSNGKDPVDQQLDQDYAVADAVNKEVARRLIQMFSKPGHVILDPFGGTGVVPVTAVELGREGILNDISEKQLEGARKRAQLVLGDNYDK